MAVAAYASVLSLMRSLDNALLPSRCWLLPNKSQVETLREKFSLLQESLELHSSSMANRDLGLDDMTVKQIRELVYEADDVLDMYVVDRLRSESKEIAESNEFTLMRILSYILGSLTSMAISAYAYVVGRLWGAESKDECDKILSSSFCQDIESLTQRIDECINQELVAKDYVKVVQPRGNSSRGRASRVDSHGKNTMVGFNDHLKEIMHQLVRPERKLKVISIVGMGGIGKTTLARHTFNNQLIKEHFHVRIWLTISQEYDVQEILRGLEHDGVIIDSRDQDLGTRLCKTLYGKQYLIVIDDVWSTQVWYDFKSFFPSNDNGSRIVITTRLSDVADSLGPNNVYSIGFLDDKNSWLLFHEKSFRNGGWSDELEEIGKKIVKHCGGLPLALVVIGGLLAKSNGDRGYWELVAENISSFLSSETEENCLRILSLSYSHLPIHLKPCFLYMGVFPEDSKIYESTLIELWVAQGIVKPDRDRITEDVAMEYIEDLVGRNMVFVRELGNTRKFRIYGIHDILRQLCIEESRKEGFLSFPTVQKLPWSFNENSCFLCGKDGTCKRIQLCQVLVGSQSTTPMTSLVCDECDARYPRLNGSRSVKVIDEIRGQLVEMPLLTKVRFLRYPDTERSNIVYASPSPVWLLWNLQVLYCQPFLVLSMIWEMPQLRHVYLDRIVALPDPVDTNDTVVLKHLQTLTGIMNLRFTKDLVERIPNIVELDLFYSNYHGSGELNCTYYCLDNLALLRNLRTLSVHCAGFSLDIKSISFPDSLKELTLYGSKFLWEDMATIGSLPNLEALELFKDAFVGDEWRTVAGQFPKLRFLRISCSDLVIWRVESSHHLPALETLVLYRLVTLKEFPSDIGDIYTLRAIKVSYCNKCIVNSVKQIKEDQIECYDNDLLRIEIEGDEIETVTEEDDD